MLLYTFSIKVSGGGAWLASHTGRFNPTEIDPVTLEYQNWTSLRAGLWDVGVKFCSAVGKWIRLFRSPSP